MNDSKQDFLWYLMPAFCAVLSLGSINFNMNENYLQL